MLISTIKSRDDKMADYNKPSEEYDFEHFFEMFTLDSHTDLMAEFEDK